MSSLEQFEIDSVIRYAGGRHCTPECGRTKIQVVLVLVTGVDPDRPQRAQRLGVLWLRGHDYWVPGQPALPHIGKEGTYFVEGKMNCAVLVGRLRRRIGVYLHELKVAISGSGYTTTEVGEESLVRAVVLIT